MKYLSINNKSRNNEFRQLLFQSQFFKQKKIGTTMSVISQYNQKEFTSSISHQRAEYSNSKLEPKKVKNIRLIKSNDLIENAKSIKEVKKGLTKIINFKIETSVNSFC